MDFLPTSLNNKNAENQIILRDKLTLGIPQSLGELLDALVSIEDETLNLSDDDLKKLLAKLECKVDGYKFRKDYLEGVEKFLDDRIGEIKAVKNVVQSRIEHLKKTLVYHLEAHGFEKLPGETYKVRIQESDSTEIIAEPTADIYAELGDDFVKMKFEWKKTEAKAALKDGNEALKKYLMLKKNKSPVFTINSNPKIAEKSKKP